MAAETPQVTANQTNGKMNGLPDAKDWKGQDTFKHPEHTLIKTDLLSAESSSRKVCNTGLLRLAGSILRFLGLRHAGNAPYPRSTWCVLCVLYRPAVC